MQSLWHIKHEQFQREVVPNMLAGRVVEKQERHGVMHEWDSVNMQVHV